MTDYIFDNSYEKRFYEPIEPEASVPMETYEWDGYCQSKVCPPMPCPPLPYPPKPPVNSLNAYAQYVISGSPASGGYLSFIPQFESGNLIASDNGAIKLSSRFIYLVNYVTQATPEANQYYQLVPYISGRPRLNYSAIGTAAANFRNASASGSFIVNESAEEAVTLQLQVTYPVATKNIDVSGTISIIPIALHCGPGR